MSLSSAATKYLKVHTPTCPSQRTESTPIVVMYYTKMMKNTSTNV